MTVRVGFVGAGNIARLHLAGLRVATTPHEIVAVTDLDPDRAADFALRSGATVVGDVDEVVARSDAVYVATWTASHLEVVRAATRAGRAVFCEKPLGRDLAEARVVAETLRQSEVIHQIGLVLRRSPIFTLLRDLVHSPRAGTPLAMVFRDDQYLPTQGRYGSTWRADRSLAGSGVLIEHSIHDVDLIEWLLGPIVEVSGRSRFVHGIDGIEDVVVAMLVHESGAITTLTTIWHDVLSRPSQRYVEVHSSDRVSTLEGEWSGRLAWADSVESTSLEGDELLEVAQREHPEASNPDDAFLAAVAEGRPARPDAADAERAHVVVDAIYRAVETGDVVPVEAGP